jgi:hypothetical protein
MLHSNLCWILTVAILFEERNALDLSKLRDFLPGAVADTLPALKASNLPKLLQAFNIREGTEMASSMETTISYCEGIANLTPEEKPASCPTSEKAMAKFVSSLLGQNVELLTSKVISAKASIIYYNNSYTMH